MLKSLRVENYAIITNLDISFDTGLSIITGETGAGKSIILGALGLIMGKRADMSVLLNTEKRCMVEAVFNIEQYGLEYIFSENDLDYDNETIIRREILPNGKSRAFINDTPTNLTVIQTITNKLIDIHSQHQTLNINNQEFQLKVVDSVAANNKLLTEYKNIYKGYQQVSKKYNDLLTKESQNKSEAEYLRFQFDELEKLSLKENEDKDLEEEHEQLSNSEGIKEALVNASTILNSEELSVLMQIKQLQNEVSKASEHLHTIKELPGRIESSYIELKDIANEVENWAERIEHDPERLNNISERLGLIYNLTKKHNVENVNGLIKLQQDISDKLLDIDNYDERIATLKKELDTKEIEIHNISKKLSESRKQAAEIIEDTVVAILNDVAIPSGKFKVDFKESENYLSTGSDLITFLFSSNEGVAPCDLSKAASGGELSRVMLAIKSLLTQATGLPTIIFDEIDTGVSGEVADKVGTIIKQMAHSMQIINITHLPQVAGKGNAHYLVYKTSSNGSTETRIKLLSQDERIQELAKMLSGETITQAAIENAKNLLSN